MKAVVYILLAAELALLGCVLSGAVAGNAAVLLLAANTVLLIAAGRAFKLSGAASSGRRKPSCCR